MPRVLGGTATVALCEGCHGKVHRRDFTDHRALTRAGLARARAAGKRLGAPPMPAFVVREVQMLYASGRFTHRTLAEHLNATGTPTASGTGKWWPKTVRAALLTELPPA